MLAVLVLFCLAVVPATRVSADASETPRVSDASSSRTCRLCGNQGWEVKLAVPLWIPTVTGSLGTARAEGPDRDFGQQLRIDSSIRFAMMAELSMRYRAWGLRVDTFGASLTSAIGFTTAGGDFGHVDVSGGMLRMAASYRVPVVELGRFARPLLLSFVPYLGTRAYRIGVGYEGQNTDRDEVFKWWDPIVGLSVHIDFRIGLVVHTECDVGGFGLGNEVAWWFAHSLEYGFLDWMSASLGWTFVRFEQDSNQRNLDLTLSMSGPQVTLSFYIQ